MVTRSRVRLAGVGTLAATLALTAAAPATAGVARLIASGFENDEGPATVRIATADEGGKRRTLGPFRLSDRPGGILAAPDGRRAALLPGADTIGAALRVVQLDGGGPPVTLTLPPGVATYGDFSRVGWSQDGAELVVGDAIWVDPALAADDAPAARPDQVRWTSLRCAVATATCVENPGPGGMAVSVPGGTVIGSSALSLFPLSFLYEGIGDTPLPEFEPATSERGRLLTGIAEDVRTSSTRIEGTAAPRVVEQQVRPASKGLGVTVEAVGGPGGALLTQTTARYRLDRRGGKVRLRGLGGPSRFVTVAPDGRVARRPVARLRVPRRERRTVGSTVDRDVGTLTFSPAVGSPDGGWIGAGVVGVGGLNGTSVATMDAAGRARFVRVRGRIATPETLVATAGGLPRNLRRVASGPLEVLGYERATRRVIVRVVVETLGGDLAAQDVALRLRLDGRGRPRVVAGGADTAW